MSKSSGIVFDGQTVRLASDVSGYAATGTSSSVDSIRHALDKEIQAAISEAASFVGLETAQKLAEPALTFPENFLTASSPLQAKVAQLSLKKMQTVKRDFVKLAEFRTLEHAELIDHIRWLFNRLGFIAKALLSNQDPSFAYTGPAYTPPPGSVSFGSFTANRFTDINMVAKVSSPVPPSKPKPRMHIHGQSEGFGAFGANRFADINMVANTSFPVPPSTRQLSDSYVCDADGTIVPAFSNDTLSFAVLRSPIFDKYFSQFVGDWQKNLQLKYDAVFYKLKPYVGTSPRYLNLKGAEPCESYDLAGEIEDLKAIRDFAVLMNNNLFDYTVPAFSGTTRIVAGIPDFELPERFRKMM